MLANLDIEVAESPVLRSPVYLLSVKMPRMPLTDVLHRSLVTGLFGLTVTGVLMGVVIHRDTLARGRGESSAVFTRIVILSTALLLQRYEYSAVEPANPCSYLPKMMAQKEAETALLQPVDVRFLVLKNL